MKFVEQEQTYIFLYKNHHRYNSIFKANFINYKIANQ